MEMFVIRLGRNISQEYKYKIWSLAKVRYIYVGVVVYGWY